VGRRLQHDGAKAQARETQGRDVTSQQSGFWPRWRTKRRRSQVLPAGPVRVGADPALHARGGELVEERYAAGRRCSMIVPRLKLVGHRAEMALHSSLGSCPRRRPSAFRAHVLPLTIVPSRPRSATGSSSSYARENFNADACGHSPAPAPAAITVGPTTSTDARSSFSSFGVLREHLGSRLQLQIRRRRLGLWQLRKLSASTWAGP